jgi:predicted ABC-type ATPase
VNGHPEREKKLAAIAAAHDDWAATHADDAEFDPVRAAKKPGSDYNQHYLDVDPPPGTEEDFHRRVRQAISIPAQKHTGIAGQAVGLAKAVSPTAKAVTTAHLTETTLHELTHAALHAQAMGDDPPGGDEWAFDADHCASHIAGAVEHAGKLWEHLHDNYPAEARWLMGIARITHPLEAQQHTAGTISGQLLLAMSAAAREKAHQTAHNTASAHAKSDERRDARGRWTSDGDVMSYRGSLGIDRADMPQVSGRLPGGRYAPAAEMMPKFLDHLKARGIPVTHERVPASTLKPSQATGDMRAVRGIAGSLASGELSDTKPALVSSDNRIIDGHHQWAAHLLGESEGTRTGTEPGEPVIRADAPAARLMLEARRFAADHGISGRKTGDAANPLYARPSISEQAAPKDSLGEHTRAGGSLTPERAALHQQIIEGILAGHQPQEHPTATFFGGGPAAGKSALKATPADTAHIDSDQVKKRLPEYQRMLDAGDPRASAYVHEESSQISKDAVNAATVRRLNFTLDGTGDSDIRKMSGKVLAAKNAGYATEGKYVTIPTDEAVRRAKGRAADPASDSFGRHVPETFIRETHASVSKTFDQAAGEGLYDKAELWDNTARTPHLVASREPGGDFTVHDPAAYRAFLDKAKEKPRRRLT